MLKKTGGMKSKPRPLRARRPLQKHQAPTTSSPLAVSFLKANATRLYTRFPRACYGLNTESIPYFVNQRPAPFSRVSESAYKGSTRYIAPTNIPIIDTLQRRRCCLAHEKRYEENCFYSHTQSNYDMQCHRLAERPIRTIDEHSFSAKA
ncbi:uncharacterized protein LOC112494921 [Cephus cinctus]|uniref:Uncharacterized protein LOC112494921 n=1 Tax=Cephus cinctus TaxID=211228 RepID=A0AAJ7RP71_CEPCN|nr:uncharacterized protein LOC112494921 [Cephus cinctus]